MKKIKIASLVFAIIFVLYSFYKVTFIYILNLSSLRSSYIYHSNTIETSKNKNLYIATYQLDKACISYDTVNSLIPKELFIEKEEIIYPQYYLYFGKSEIGKRYSIDGTSFLSLSKYDEFVINCPTSTLQNQNENIDRFRKHLYFFFDNIPSQITFFLNNEGEKLKHDTLLFRKYILPIVQ